MSEKNIKDQQPYSRPRSQSMSSQNTASQTTNEQASQESEHGRGMNLEEVINEELLTVPTVVPTTIEPSKIEPSTGPSTPQYYDSESETYVPISPYSDTIYSKPSVVASGIETKITDDPYILIQEYNRLDEKIDTFFFERVDGMFEYLLFLILYKYLGIFGPYQQKNIENDTSSDSESTSISQTPPQTPRQEDVIDVSPVSTIGGDGSHIGGAGSDCSGNFTNPDMKNIRIIKLYKELNHDFKNLDDMDSIRNFCLKYVEDNTKTEPKEEYLKNLYKSIRNGSGDEWNFYTSILEYYCEGCGGFDDLTMIRYKSCTEKDTDEKTYILRDINSYPSGDNSYGNLFVVDDLKYRYRDNGTVFEVLSNLVSPEERDNFESSIKTIKNAPSLIDPSTVHPINMSKFYPRDAEIFEFQKCQDLNNISDSNNSTVQNIMKAGIKQFFSYFGAEGINIDSVSFIVFQDNSELDDPLTNNLYQFWLTNLNNFEFSGKNCPFYYNGIRISVDDSLKRPAEVQITNEEESKLARFTGVTGGAGQTKLDLHVGDLAIPNITELINSGYYIDSSKPTYTSTNGIQIILDAETKNSWNRVVNFSKYIMEKSNSNFKKYNYDFLRFIIISLKSFGDSFQVYYSTAIQRLNIQQNNTFFPGISDKTYLSSSDKNIGAEKMLYASPFLLNGCGIHPYQGLQERFPAFFNDELSVDEMGDKGDIGSKHGTQYKMGYSKAILTNIKSDGKDYKRYVQVLSNQIVGMVEKKQSQNADMLDIINSSSSSSSGEIINLYEEIEQWTNPDTPPPEDAEKISKVLQVIYNKLKIFQENDNELDKKIDVFLDDFEKQEEYLTNLIQVNRSPTTEELKTLINNLDKDPEEAGLESELRALISKATNTIITNNYPVTSSSSSSSSSTSTLYTSDKMMKKINEFITKVKSSVTKKKTKLIEFIKTLEPEKPQRPSRRPSGISGLMDLLTSKVRVYTAQGGGGSKSRKNRKIYLKKYTRRNGFHPTKKRKTRNNIQQIKDRRKTIKK